MSVLKLIAGSGRSGTTWVLDALAVANKLRPVFEPLNPWASAIGEKFAHRALAPEDPHPDLLEYFLGVCAGKHQRLWTQYRRQPRWLFPPRAKLASVSDVANLMHVWQKFLGEVPRLAQCRPGRAARQVHLVQPDAWMAVSKPPLRRRIDRQAPRRGHRVGVAQCLEHEFCCRPVHG